MTPFRFHHLGVAVRKLQPAVETYERVFGFRLLRGPIDDPIQRVTASFVGTGEPGDVMYELVAPLEGADGSPIDRILEKENRSYHVCYEVPALEATLAHMKRERCAVISGPHTAVAFGGRQLAWVLTPTWHIVELLEAGSVDERTSGQPRREITEER